MMDDDLFGGTAPAATSAKKACLACGLAPEKPHLVLCEACRAHPLAAAEMIAAEVDALDAQWRALLHTASERTQARWVAVIVAHGEAYEPASQQVQRKRIAAFRSRLRKTIDAGGEIGAIAAAYERYLVRRGAHVTVAVIATLRGPS